MPYFISIKMIKEMTMFPREKEFIELLDKNKRPGYIKPGVSSYPMKGVLDNMIDEYIAKGG